MQHDYRNGVGYIRLQLFTMASGCKRTCPHQPLVVKWDYVNVHWRLGYIYVVNVVSTYNHGARAQQGITMEVVDFNGKIRFGNDK